MTPLGREIEAKIAAEGPIPLDRYMALCLSHPAHGYYATRDPFGRRGDFVTAPEISQIFGELLGLWAAEVWRVAGAPDRVSLVELGPGRGTLMADMLRAAKAAPGFLAALDVALVETSPALAEIQAETLARASVLRRWVRDVEAALEPGRPAIVIANEFFDALPIRQFARVGRGWRERLVGLAPGGGLAFGLAAEPPVALQLAAAPDGAIREISPQALEIAGAVAAHVAAHGGAMLAIDYGYGSGHGDTFQAMKAHGFVDPLEAPGDADLTAHVDFGALALAGKARGAAPMRLLDQSELLERLGIAARAEALAASAPARRVEIVAACERLTDRRPRGMGRLFKALAICDPRMGPPPAFEPLPAQTT